MSGSASSPELNARVGLMFSKRVRVRSLMKARFWGGSHTYIYIHRIYIYVRISYIQRTYMYVYMDYLGSPNHEAPEAGS